MIERNLCKLGIAGLVGMACFQSAPNVLAATSLPVKRTTFELGERIVMVPDTFVDTSTLTQHEKDSIKVESTLMRDSSFNYSNITKEVTSATHSYLNEGRYNVSITFNDTTRHIQFNVKDTTKPSVHPIEDIVRVPIGTSMNSLKEYLDIKDYSDYKIRLFHDLNKAYQANLPGDYIVHILVQDTQLNTTSTSIHVQVVDEKLEEKELKESNQYTRTVIEKEKNDSSTIADGWHDLSYYKNGQPLKGLQYVDGFWYFFQDSGEYQTGWATVDGKTMYFDEFGQQIFGEKEIDGFTYLFDNKTGEKVAKKPVEKQEVSEIKSEGNKEEMVEEKEGFITENQNGNEVTYYYKDGKKQTGLVEISTNEETNYAYFDENGVQQYGFQSIVKNTRDEMYNYMYYFDKGNQGFAVKGMMKMPYNEDTVYFNESGVMSFGFTKIKDNVYYFDKFADGAMHTGFLHYNGNTYYFKEDGTMAFGPTKIADEKQERTLFFAEDGHQLSGYVQWGDDWYYFDEMTGEKKTGWVTIPAKENDGVEKTVYFNEDGTMKTGHHQEGESWYYLTNTGEKAVGVIDIPSRTSGTTVTCAYDKDGKQLFGQQTIEGKTYLFADEDGHAIDGFHYDNGILKYMEKGEGFVTGEKSVGNFRIYADETGRIYRTERLDVPYYSQKSGWRGFGGYTFAESGCVPSSLAMAISALTSNQVTPDIIGSDLYYRGFFNNGIKGTTLDAIPYTAKKYGVQCQGNVRLDAIRTALLEGKIAIMCVGPGSYPWTNTAIHEMVLHSYDSNTDKVYVEDPYSIGTGWYSLSYVYGHTFWGSTQGGGPWFILS